MRRTGHSHTGFCCTWGAIYPELSDGNRGKVDRWMSQPRSISSNVIAERINRLKLGLRLSGQQIGRHRTGDGPPWVGHCQCCGWVEPDLEELDPQ